ncbi:MAG: RagB/SusD family nutrient uptake outer membrane protein [Tannerellaceae bacterium]|jgi:hypothetical protein|nr:RagB/SusD family nutrient uptake outer membrane protein [Tannerellaceae bacterium]
MKQKIIAYSKYLFGGLLLLISACTDLSETLYDRIVSDNFYNTKENAYQGYVRSFEHNYWAATQARPMIQEGMADHMVIANRQGNWYNNGIYQRLHWHTMEIEDQFHRDVWNHMFDGIGFANNSYADISGLDPAKFNMDPREIENMKAQLRSMRAWYYINLFDMFRNIPLVTEYPSPDPMPSQVEPMVIFNFIESEIKEIIPQLEKKVSTGGNGIKQGQWTQAGAACILMQLYLNASVWIGQDRLSDCEKVAQDIIDGVYGVYDLSPRWDGPFDSDNESCDEIIYACPSFLGYRHLVYGGTYQWGAIPYLSVSTYFNHTNQGRGDQRWGVQPGLDLQGNEYTFKNGKPVRKFLKYPDDYRLIKYRNLGDSRREGLFIHGYLDYVDDSGETKYVMSNTGGYTLYMRDQYGWFEDTDPSSISPAPTQYQWGNGSSEGYDISDIDHCDQNSGWILVKYPIYPSGENTIDTDYPIFRLAEVYYTLAECKFRKGDNAGAAKLLNAVRKRNYPSGSPSLYKEDGSQITAQELLDEWGREFIFECRRRTDLIRFGVFTEGNWWSMDKVDHSEHTLLLPLSYQTLTSNPNLRQNPGWPDIKRD